MKMKKKTKKSSSGNRACNGENKRLKSMINGLRKDRGDLTKTIKQQTHDLKVKNGLIKNGKFRQIRSEEQIHIRDKAMESAVDGIFIIDAQKPNYPVVYANRSFQKMTGYTKREILSRGYFLLYGADADPRILSDIKQTMRQGKTFYGEMISFQKNGKAYLNLLRITPVRDSNGAVTHYVGIQTDVTAMRGKELEIDEQREELLHVTRVGKLAEFVSSLAHEISQPLAAILSYSQAAQRMLAGKDPELEKVLLYIIADNKRATDVIHRLRSLLKKNKPEMKPLDINDIVNETIMLIATDAAVRKDVLKTELKSGLPPVLGDRIQLQQVLLNLISNSFDALDDAKGARGILVRTWRKDAGTIVVEVKDSGCGIPAQNIPKLFMHFFTSKPDGLGMGLSISRSIVEAHGGRLDVKNNPGRGATFYFTLPVDKRAPHDRR